MFKSAVLFMFCVFQSFSDSAFAQAPKDGAVKAMLMKDGAVKAVESTPASNTKIKKVSNGSLFQRKNRDPEAASEKNNASVRPTPVADQSNAPAQ